MRAECEILGSGTSVGVPMPGCNCPGCTSDDPRDNRMRSSVRLQISGLDILIDTATDLRMQALRSGLMKIDAILLTHNHADHVSGLDDVRPFCFNRANPIPVFGNDDTLEWIRKRYDYIWEAKQEGGGLPKLTLNNIDRPFTIENITITPIPVMHGIMEILGYRIGNFAYISDVSHIPDSSFKLLEGVERLVIDGLRYKKHATHFCIDEAVEAAQKISPQQTWLTHLSHDCLYAELCNQLPGNIEPAYDGLKFSFSI